MSGSATRAELGDEQAGAGVAGRRQAGALAVDEVDARPLLVGEVDRVGLAERRRARAPGTRAPRACVERDRRAEPEAGAELATGRGSSRARSARCRTRASRAPPSARAAPPSRPRDQRGGGDRELPGRPASASAPPRRAAPRPAARPRRRRGRASRATRPRSARSSSVERQTSLAHLLPQPLERAREARLDRARPHAERRGGLGLGELEQVAAADHRAVVLAQPAERGEQRGAALAREERRLRGGGRLPGGALLARGAERERRPPAGRPAAVARLVGDDRQQPRPQRLARAGSGRARGRP